MKTQQQPSYLYLFWLLLLNAFFMPEAVANLPPYENWEIFLGDSDGQCQNTMSSVSAQQQAFAAYTDLSVSREEVLGIIVANNKIKEEIADALMQAMHTDDEVTEYMQLVFRGMPELRIRYMATPGDRWGKNASANFSPWGREIWVRSHDSVVTLAGVLVHEFEHAYRVLERETLEGSITKQSIDPFLPDEYVKHWQRADARIAEIRTYLRKAAYVELAKRSNVSTDEAKKRIGFTAREIEQFKLYKAAAKTAAKNTESLLFQADRWVDVMVITDRMRVSYEGVAGIKISPGAVINFDPYASEDLNFLMRGRLELIKVEKAGDGWSLTFRYLDPLMKLVLRHEMLKYDVENYYSPDRVVMERSAYLRQHFPSELIKIVYSEIDRSDRERRAAVRDILTPHLPLSDCRLDETCRAEYMQRFYEKVSTLEISSGLSKKNTEIIVDYAEWLSQAGKFKQALSIFKQLAAVNKFPVLRVKIQAGKALAYHALGQYQKAKRCIEKALGKNSENLSRLVAIDVFFAAKTLLLLNRSQSDLVRAGMFSANACSVIEAFKFSDRWLEACHSLEKRIQDEQNTVRLALSPKLH